jgi:hypothetical protein
VIDDDAVRSLDSSALWRILRDAALRAA